MLDIDYHSITTLLVTALRGSNSGEQLNALSAAARKMGRNGFDIHDLGIYDTSRVLAGTGATVGPAQIIRSKNATIQNLTTERDELRMEVELLRRRLSSKVSAHDTTVSINNSGKTLKFNWNEFPEDENRICLDFVSGGRKAATLTAQALTKSLHERGYEIFVTEGIIRQRLNSSAPPDVVIDLIKSSSPTPTWPELWYLGAKLSPRAWNQTVFTQLGFDEGRDVGSDLSDISPAAFAALREYVSTIIARQDSPSNGRTKKFIIDAIRKAGSAGITRAEVINLDRANTNITKRFTEIIDTGVVSEISGRLIHQDFKDDYPVAWEKAQTARAAKLAR